MSTIVALVVLIAPLSIVTIGSSVAILPELSRVGTANGWLSPRELAEIYSIVQVSPGPNIVYLTAFGWRAAGLPGALAAQAAMIVPPSILVYIVARSWHRFGGQRWAVALRRGLAPIAVGSVLASGLTLAAAADRTPAMYAVTAVAALVAYLTKVHLLIVVGIAALVGLLGLLS